MNTYNIAILTTCHNRRKKTINSLQSLFISLDAFNNSRQGINISSKVFLTDDGCVDDTVECISKDFKDKDIKIIKGNGQLFWAGGMRLCWEIALTDKTDWDFFLLINDDTVFTKYSFTELIKTHLYAIKHFHKAGIYSGIISSFDNKEITYGGKKYTSRFIGKSVSITPNGKPQQCMMTNANMLLVSKYVQSKIGILDSHYQHSCADWAYGIEAYKAGFPVLVTGNICGYCNNDHDTSMELKEKLNKMSISNRIKYFSFPTHSTKDILRFMWHYNKIKFCLVIIARIINILSPNIYYKLDKKR